MLDEAYHTFNLAPDSLDWLYGSIAEEAIPSHSGNYTIPGIGTFNFPFLDAKYLKDGIEFFRPLIRGFVALLLIFFNFRHFLSFINQTSESGPDGKKIDVQLKEKGGK